MLTWHPVKVNAHLPIFVSPSGSTTPSKEDIELTQRVKTAGDMLDVKLLDHVIVTEKEYLSLLDERLF